MRFTSALNTNKGDESLSGERVYLGIGDHDNIALHVERYRFAASKVRDRHVVLDAASGSGYGARILSQYARVVTGLEISRHALAHSQREHQTPNVCYCQADLNVALPIVDRSIDVVVSLETIEHVADPGKLLSEFHRVLRAGGMLILSTPNRAVSEMRRHRNPFHVREFTRDELIRELSGYFSVSEIYGQVRFRQSRFSGLLLWVSNVDVLNFRRVALKYSAWLRRIRARYQPFRIEVDQHNMERIAALNSETYAFHLIVATVLRKPGGGGKR